MENPKAFCSHRSVDKPRVMEVFRKLREAGIDAWVDEWEILAGQDFVAQINRGLDECDVGLVFLSQASMAGKWQQAEIAALTTMAVEEGKPLIPVLLDQDTPVPALLRSRSRLSHEQFDQLVDAIYGRPRRPPLGPARRESTVYPFVIRLRSIEPGDIGISAVTEAGDAIDEVMVRPGAAFVFSFTEFLRNRPFGSRLGGAKQAVIQREKDLIDLGRAVGKVVFPGTIALRLQELIGKASRKGATVNLFFETGDTELLSIPFEAARFEDGRAPVLEAGVRIARRLGSETAAHDGLPGPLKILVAVGAPDEGKTKSSVLDLEAELKTIIDAVEDARRFGNAFVKILEVAHPDEITKAMRERSYHVLHLSGHGRQGMLELEDEDGNPVEVTAGEIVGALLESGRPLPFIFLSACHSGRGDSETTSVAQGLLEKGVPAVLAMQAAVSDRYAIELAKGFYATLAMSELPLVSVAIALARREVEAERKKTAAAGVSQQVPEYATPSLFLRGEERPLLDRSQKFEPIKESPRPRAAGTVPLLDIGDLVGRREEVRTIMRILTDDPRAVEQFGHKAGCVITGIGGVGKSTVAGRVMERLTDKGWFVFPISGTVSPGELSFAIARAAMADGFEGIRAPATPLRDETLGDEDRLYLLTQLLANHPVLLVLDNFEDNLVPGENTYQDPITANLIQTLCTSAHTGRLLITSRYPLPESSAWLVTRHLGPLSVAQTGKLFLRHPRLRDAAPENVKLIQRIIGGHPRMIEYLDAILNQGRARLAAVEEKLRQLAARENVDLKQSGDKIEDKIRKALDLGVADIMLDELLDLAGKKTGDRQLLLQASVFPMPVLKDGLERTLTIGGIVDEIEDIDEAIKRLVALSLLTRLEGDYLWVHRWTAEALHERTVKEDYQRFCCNGGYYLQEETAKTPSIETAIESARLLLLGQAWEESTALAWEIVSFLENYGQTVDLASFCSEVTTLLPQSNDQWPSFTLTKADALLKIGYGQPAFEQYQVGMKAQERLVDQEPERADYLRDLSVSYNKMGDLQSALGQGEAAGEYYKKALEIAQRLVDQEPERADYLRDLSVSYERMGDLQSALGQGEAAGEYYKKALEIAQRLVDQEPERADYLRDLSVSYERMGDLQRALGQGEAAGEYYKKSLKIAQRLVDQEPERADYLRDLSVSYERMGDLQSALGQGEAAGEYYKKALEIAQRLVDQEPERADYLRDLSVSYNKMGDLQRALGQGEAAGEYYKKALEIAQRLVDQEPERADYLRDLSVSYERMGDLQSALGQGEAAGEYYKKALEIAQRLVDQEPERADYLRDLSVSYNKMGDLQRALGQGEAAGEYYKKSLKIAYSAQLN